MIAKMQVTEQNVDKPERPTLKWGRSQLSKQDDDIDGNIEGSSLKNSSSNFIWRFIKIWCIVFYSAELSRVLYWVRENLQMNFRK